MLVQWPTNKPTNHFDSCCALVYFYLWFGLCCVWFNFCAALQFSLCHHKNKTKPPFETLPHISGKRTFREVHPATMSASHDHSKYASQIKEEPTSSQYAEADSSTNMSSAGGGGKSGSQQPVPDKPTRQNNLQRIQQRKEKVKGDYFFVYSRKSLRTKKSSDFRLGLPIAQEPKNGQTRNVLCMPSTRMPLLQLEDTGRKSKSGLWELLSVVHRGMSKSDLQTSVG